MGRRDDEPVDVDEFRTLMAGCLRHCPGDVRHIVLGVSGGPDSTALMALAAGFVAGSGKTAELDVSVATVDHALRAASDAEAEAVAEAARRLGLSHTTLVWTGSRPRSGIQAAAREVRFRLIGDHMRSRGCRVLALAHTEDDQAETMLMRLARGSGADGLAAMQPVSVVDGIEVIRPFLGIPKSRLIATLQARDIPWIEDPSNASERFERGRLRRAAPALAAAGLGRAALALAARRLARASAALDEVTRRTVATGREHVAVDALGFATLDWNWLVAEPEDIRIRILQRLIGKIGGNGARPVPLGKLEAMTAGRGWSPPPGLTLAGCMLWISRSRCVLLAREPGRRGLPTVPVAPGATVEWDDRFAIGLDRRASAGITVGGLGADGLAVLDALRLERPPVPARVLHTLPALWREGRLVGAPMLGYRGTDLDQAQVQCRFIAWPFPR